MKSPEEPRSAWLHLILYGSASVDPLHALDVLYHFVARHWMFPGSGDVRRLRRGQQEKSPHELHTVFTPPATQATLMGTVETRSRVARSRGGELQCPYC